VEIIKNKKGRYQNDDDDKYNNDETPTTPTTNRMIEVRIGGGEHLRNIMWQGCDDPARDRTRDCVRATRYRGRTIKHAT
jgi:hypothetical protein